MPSYLNFDSTKQFRDFIIGKTLNKPNGPQTFTKDNYDYQKLSNLSNVDPGSVDKNRTNDLIQISDKIIVLYRENLEVQLESFINGSITNKWDAKWMYKFIDDTNIDKKTQLLIDNFFEVKNDIKKDLIESEKYFTISYEELYFNNGFQKLVDYINLEEVQNINFPFGEKYRIDFDKNKFI
jgi:hypothetical protein